MDKTRNGSVEALRCLLMLLICLTHSFNWVASPYPNKKLMFALSFSVVAFIFISGWYGVRLKWRKVAGLLASAAYACLIIQLVSLVSGKGFSLREAVKEFNGYWFLHGYMVLMLCAPMLNWVCESLPREKMVSVFAPFFLLVFGWGWLRTWPIGWVFPVSPGVEAYSGLMMVGVYCAARLCRLNGLERFATAGKLAAVAPLALVVAAFGFGEYTSPLTFALAAMLVMFVHVHGQWKCTWTRWMVPSLFSVYLLHTNSFGFVAIANLQQWLHGIGLPVVVLNMVSAIVVFSVCLVLDIPRRVAGRVVWA